MIDLRCQYCGKSASVQSMLEATQQPCDRCGQLLMGTLEPGTRTRRPLGFSAPLPPPLVRRPARTAYLWLGMLAGVLAGLALVGAVALLGPALSLPLRGTMLGALTGVLLAPVIGMCLLADTIILPWSLTGMIGDSTWTRLATAIRERRFGPALGPLFIFLVLPMALCGLGGSRMTAIHTPMLVSAGLGAVLLGTFGGGLCGAIAGKARWAEENISNRGIDVALLSPDPSTGSHK